MFLRVIKVRIPMRRLEILTAVLLGMIAGVWNLAEAASSITLERSVHFKAAAGGDVVAFPGVYTVLAVENSRLLLIPEKGSVPLLIQAHTISHAESVLSAIVRSVSGDGDEHHVLVLLPDGQGRDAIGSYSGSRAVAVPPPQRMADGKPSAAMVAPRALSDPVLAPVSAAPLTASSPPADNEVLTTVHRLQLKLADLEARLTAMERLLATIDAKLAPRLEDRK
jgi:hypothetical protein